MVELAPNYCLEEARLAMNEHWAVLDGRLLLTVDEMTATLCPGDIALIRTGAMRALRSLEPGRAVVCRE
jgi:mannose-6-phosphate isomerase-like protein (cupin superfamily)